MAHRTDRYPLPFLPRDWPAPAQDYLTGRAAMLRAEGLPRDAAAVRAEEATRRWWALGRGGVPPAWPRREASPAH